MSGAPRLSLVLTKGAAVSGDVFQRGSVLKCFGLNQANRCNFRLGRKGFSAHPRQGIINMTLQPTRIALNRVWADRFARPLWTGTFSSTCLAGKPWIGSPGRRANFEHFELGRGSINFKVFKVASTDQARHPNFEHVELGRGSTHFKVFKVAEMSVESLRLRGLQLQGEV